MRYASIGSISSGTLRSEDLLSTFAYELGSLLRKQPRRFKRAEYRALIREARKLESMFSGSASDSQFAADFSDGTVSDLQDALGDFAPPYGYFGTIEGDGAEFGFYVQDPRESEFDGLAVDDLSEVPADYRGEVLVINDHGNMTLYVAGSRGRLREVWGVV